MVLLIIRSWGGGGSDGVVRGVVKGLVRGGSEGVVRG